MVNWFPKKKWGQNFLVDEAVKKKIFEILDIEGGKVVEIGPGRGEMSEYISQKAGEFIACEIDPKLAADLQEKFKDSPNTTVLNRDFLEYFFEDDDKAVVVGNIPYNITSEILFKMFQNHKVVRTFYCVLQNEVALRITAAPGQKQYGKLSVTAQYFGRCEYFFKIDKSSFWPSPKVDSAFIKIEFYQNVITLEAQNFLEFVGRSFASQRKKLINNWKVFMNNEQINLILEEFELPENIRPQEVSVPLYIRIYHFVKENEIF